MVENRFVKILSIAGIMLFSILLVWVVIADGVDMKFWLLYLLLLIGIGYCFLCMTAFSDRFKDTQNLSRLRMFLVLTILAPGILGAFVMFITALFVHGEEGLIALFLFQIVAVLTLILCVLITIYFLICVLLENRK